MSDTLRTMRWLNAGGMEQLAMLAAASRAARGEGTRCPRCRTETLRSYAHRFDRVKGTGTTWVWCPRCRIWDHGPRLLILRTDDPYEGCSTQEFLAIERDPSESFLDRMDRLWNEGILTGRTS